MYTEMILQINFWPKCMKLSFADKFAFPCEVTIIKTEIKVFLLPRWKLFTRRSIHTGSNDRRLERGQRDGWWCRISNVNVRTRGEQLHRVQLQPLQRNEEALGKMRGKKSPKNLELFGAICCSSAGFQSSKSSLKNKNTNRLLKENVEKVFWI